MNGDAHLLTGATGFVGGAIALELLRETDGPLLCVVRAGAAGAQARLDEALSHAARVYDEQELWAREGDRASAIAGDLTAPGCGVDLATLPPVAEVWHAAASLAFEDEREPEIAQANIGGTEAVVALAEGLGARALNHVSTAYVGGARTGTMLEQLLPLDAPCNNAYERTKLRAEHVADGAALERVRILRPSIVVGHGRTSAATTFTGLYGVVRGFAALRRQVAEVLGDFLLHRPLRLQGAADVPVNLVPVDAVARNAVALSRVDATSGIFHLTNVSPPTVGETMDVIAHAVGIRPPRFVASAEAFTSIDREVNDQLRFYASYVRDAKLFDRTNVEAVLGDADASYAMPPERIDRWVRWYRADRERRHAERARQQEVATDAR